MSLLQLPAGLFVFVSAVTNCSCANDQKCCSLPISHTLLYNDCLFRVLVAPHRRSDAASPIRRHLRADAASATLLRHRLRAREERRRREAGDAAHRHRGRRRSGGGLPREVRVV